MVLGTTTNQDKNLPIKAFKVADGVDATPKDDQLMEDVMVFREEPL